MVSFEFVETVRVIEHVRIAVGPGQRTDKRKRLSVVFGMTHTAVESFSTGQKRVIALFRIELADNLRVTA